MPQDSSFDIVSRVDLQEVKNAVQQALKEAKQRFDFKGSTATIELDETARTLELRAENDTRAKALREILSTKLIKRNLPLQAFDFSDATQAGGGVQVRKVKIQDGIPTEKSREIVKLIKASKLKVQVAIQGDQLRVTGKKRDDLQAVMTLLKEAVLGIDMQFLNLR